MCVYEKRGGYDQGLDLSRVLRVCDMLNCSVLSYFVLPRKRDTLCVVCEEALSENRREERRHR